jgi:ribonuclease VapC
MLNIKDAETDRLARRLARLTGESITKAVRTAVQERLEREERQRGRPSVEHLMAIARRYASRQVIDDRSPDEIIGYDERAIFLLEKEAEQFACTILEARRAAISAANLLEASIILDSRIGNQDSSELDEFIANVGIEVEPVTLAQVRVVREAYRAYGRGNHSAGLNFGDCSAYALAKTTGLPLLFKGHDFAQTDVTPAV